MARDSMREESPGQTAGRRGSAGRAANRAGGWDRESRGRKEAHFSGLPPSFSLSFGEGRRGDQ